MQRSSGPRKTAKLPASIHHQLNMYALAASAAGVGMLAAAPSAEGKVVYTPAHKIITQKPLPIDLNRDGIIDFWLWHTPIKYQSGSTFLSACLSTPKASGSGAGGCFGSTNNRNAFRVVESDLHGQSHLWGAAVKYGARITGGDRFRSGEPASLGIMRTFYTASSRFFGPWMNGGKGVKNRFVGIRFLIRGHFHYGWARVTVTIQKTNFTATLTGYAYETIPGKGIVAGQTKGPDEINSIEPSPAALTAPTPEPATLGALAMGAPGLSIWRRKESSLDGQ